MTVLNDFIESKHNFCREVNQQWQQNGEAKPLINKQWVEAASRNQIPLSIKTADTDRKSIDGVGYYGFN
ncbi:hypothetical protein ACFO4O_06470 [Glaciecola siphonariae]|uniref:Uncharacterized protein n=1 Tax=Glaciecola siphonariae TaxID=521012 RepID=A0ABV9LVD0_9ALTE